MPARPKSFLSIRICTGFTLFAKGPKARPVLIEPERGSNLLFSSRKPIPISLENTIVSF